MLDFISVMLAILGTVIGSGFISGKEISVFFTRFGSFSFFTIILAFFIFWFLFHLVLNKGEYALERLKNSKLSFILNILLCIIFSSAMFAGVNNILVFDNKIINLFFILFILIVCTIIFKKGAKFLNKTNFVLVPVMLISLIILLSLNLSFTKIDFSYNNSIFLSPFYSCLYCVLNTANGCVMISQLGKKLTKKQKARVSFISALVLMLILLFANIVLLNSSLNEDMPLLTILNGSERAIMNILIFIGCITTLFSLVYTSSFSMRGLCNNEFFIYFLSIIAPYLSSLLSFGFIVTYLYPLCSIMGIFILIDLFFIPFFKRTDKKIHSSSKYTK